MRSFIFKQPNSLEETFDLLEAHGDDLRLLAGGTDLTVGLRQGIAMPDIVVDLKRVADLANTVETSDEQIRIGASAVISDIVKNDDVVRLFPALVESAIVVGSIQIRNRATIAGNVCNASPAADTVPVLAAYGASVTLGSRQGRRSVPVADFILGNRHIDLRRGEIVLDICIPVPARHRGCAFSRLTRRRGVDLAIINLACTCAESGVTEFALGAAAPRPLLVSDTAGELVAAAKRGDDVSTIIDRLLACAKPISDIRASAEYRRNMFSVLAQRTFEKALSRRDSRIGEH